MVFAGGRGSICLLASGKNSLSCSLLVNQVRMNMSGVDPSRSGSVMKSFVLIPCS